MIQLSPHEHIVKWQEKRNNSYNEGKAVRKYRNFHCSKSTVKHECKISGNLRKMEK